MSDIFDIGVESVVDDSILRPINGFSELDCIKDNYVILKPIICDIKLSNDDLCKIISIYPSKIIKSNDDINPIFLYHKDPIENYSGIKFDTYTFVYIPNKLNKNTIKNLKVNCSCFEIDKNSNYTDDYHSSMYMENCDITTKDYRINYSLFNTNLRNSTINTKNIFVCYYDKFFVSKLDKWYSRNTKIEFKDILNKFNLGFLGNNNIEILSFYCSTNYNMLNWFIIKNDCMNKIMTFKEHPSININSDYKLVLGKLL